MPQRLGKKTVTGPEPLPYGTRWGYVNSLGGALGKCDPSREHILFFLPLTEFIGGDIG